MDLMREGGYVVGIDPGAHTGIVMLKVGKDLAPTLVVDVAEVTPSGSKYLLDARRDADYVLRIQEVLARATVSCEVHVALEEPLDATTAWRGHGRQQKGTAFRLGAYYMCAVAAAANLGPNAIELCSYPVTGYGKRAGWMRGPNGKIANRERLMSEIIAQMRAIRCPGAAAWSEHQVMAAGVALFHLQCLRDARLAEKIRQSTLKPGPQGRRRVG